MIAGTAVPRARDSRFRLRGVGAFEAVFSAGRRQDANHVQLIAAPATQTPGRVGYVIAAKVMPRAVDRNRLRRRLRELVRAARPGIEAFDVIFRVKRSTRRGEIARAQVEAAQMLARLLAAQS